MPGEKTEKASAKRREDERKKGHAFQSQDIITAASMLCFFMLFKVMGSGFGVKIADGFRQIYSDLSSDSGGPELIKTRLATVVSVSAGVLIPIMLTACAVSVISTLVQTRLLVNFGQAKPDFSRMSPIQGIKRMFSVRSLAELVKAILKVAAVGLVIYIDLRTRVHSILLLFDMGLPQSFSWTVQLILDVGFKASAAMLAIGVGDYFFQWWSFERDIRMSKEEVKEEFKQMEGNPETKSRIRGLQRQMARSRMMQAVPEADVVIRNPTHYAIALKYDRQKSGAPVVLAKGQDQIALKIVEIALKHKIYVTENKPLARALYKAVEVGDEIPSEFYKAVAEVLAYIYRLRQAGRQ